ncbi:MAG: hypothetical protein NZ777_16520 [Pseudomonadales bacterium]|nr:hypothetical protein [Pseudomonadales bacterium]
MAGTRGQRLRARYFGTAIPEPKQSTLPKDVQRAIVQIHEALEEIREYKHDRIADMDMPASHAREHNPECTNLADDTLSMMQGNAEFVLIMQRHAEQQHREWLKRVRR